ncbi:hypothetical protein REC12_05545 [Desulfosporosinus sp. PR]|uniref:hypothetical protein n=1 Tax=Candidatus Desulfosporosinus nitrosoreducens TaxID=3401928 RepID=UPI0027F00E0B|nr:hypothetical protein [Desulfosporosinus sp. PR]MDQ7093046.1 hypothetical protein [Desulfosporosinus sp. PR]
MLLWGLALGSIIVLWKVSSCWEWSIPPRFQAFLQKMKENFSRGTRRLLYDWKESGEGELEKSFGDLQRQYPFLRKKHQVPIWIEVCLHQTKVSGLGEKYLACLQRRFPNIEICVNHQQVGGSDDQDKMISAGE